MTAFHENMLASVLCPNCSKDFLQAKDLYSRLNDTVKERVLSCPSCGASVAARMQADPDEERSGEISEALELSEIFYRRRLDQRRETSP